MSEPQARVEAFRQQAQQLCRRLGLPNDHSCVAAIVQTLQIVDRDARADIARSHVR